MKIISIPNCPPSDFILLEQHVREEIIRYCAIPKHLLKPTAIARTLPVKVLVSGAWRQEAKMDKIELVQSIGDLICEGCGPDADCGINPSECSRIKNAVELLDEYLAQVKS